MKTKYLLITIILLAVYQLTLAQKKVDDKHENHFKDVAPIETEYYKIEFGNTQSQKEFIMTKATFTNKTQDVLLVDLSAVKFITELGEYTNRKSKELQIDPYDSKSVTLKVDGGTEFHVEKFTLDIDQISYVPVNGQTQSGENFSLPARNNSMTVGTFECTLGKLTKKTDKMEAKFDVIYKGNKIGIVDANKIAVKFPNGNEYANVDKPSKFSIGGNSVELLNRGDKSSFSVKSDEHKPDGDMQFIELLLVWNDAFIETEKKPVDGASIDFELDFAKTEAMNK